jgi:DNA invertase Pin-like site-specific DNA recombinase
MAQPVRAVAYYRMSSDHQETSIPNQRSAVTDYAAKNGYQVLREYLDEGISGDDTARRTGFLSLIRDAGKKRDFKAVPCWDQDRFLRTDPLEAGYWIKPLRDAGIRLVTVAQGVIEWDTFAGRVLFTIQQEGKHQFLTDLSFKCMTGQLEGAKAGHWMGGAAPYGLRSVEIPGLLPGSKKRPHVLIPGDPAPIEIVRWLFRTYAEKDVSIRWLADELHRRGVPTPKGLKCWAPSTVRGILRRREYVGDLDWGKIFSGGYHRLEGQRLKVIGRRTMNREGTRPQRERLGPDDFVITAGVYQPIIERDLWEAVQAKLRGNRDRKTPVRAGGSWLMAGLLVCGHCGSRMVGSTNTSDKANDPKARVYICNGYHAHGLKYCHRHQVKEYQMADCVLRKLQEKLLNPDNLELLREEIRRQEEEEAARPAGGEQLKARLAELDRDIEQGNLNMARAKSVEAVEGIAAAVRAWREEKGRLTAEAERATAGRADLQAAVDAAERQLWRLREAVQEGDPAEVRAVLRERVSRVVLRWDCGERGLRQRCTPAGGIIHVRLDARLGMLDSCDRTSLWL